MLKKSMKKTFAILGVLTLGVIILSNTFLGVFIGKPLIHVYHYESSDRNYADFECPEKGRKFETVRSNFEEYKRLSGNMNSRLCRTSKRSITKFYEWWNFLTHPRWECPYITPSTSPNKDWRKKHNHASQAHFFQILKTSTG